MAVRELNANKQIEPPTLLRLHHPRLSEINEGTTVTIIHYTQN